MDISPLEHGRLWPFELFPGVEIPRNIAGVYTIWEGGTFVYVGLGGLQVRYAEPDSEAAPAKPVEPTLTPEQIREIAAGRVSLDHLTRDWIRSKFGFRWLETPGGGPQAREVEDRIRRGGLDVGRPLLNGIAV